MFIRPGLYTSGGVIESFQQQQQSVYVLETQHSWDIDYGDIDRWEDDGGRIHRAKLD